MKSVFAHADVEELVARIESLQPTTQGLWGSMSVDQMLAHVNVAYEMVYENIHPKPVAIMRFLLKTFIKKKVVGPDPYPKNTPTAPAFRIKEPKNFEQEKQRLLGYLRRVQQEGASAFEGRESLSFGALTSNEWNGLFYKHLDHHLTQFGV